MGSYDEAPAARRTPSKVTAQPRTWQTTGKISASRDAATIVVTQTVEAKKKWKQTRPTVLVDTATVSSGIETIEVDEEEGDAESPIATVAPSVGTPRRVASMEEQAVETPRRTSATEECPRSSVDIVGDLGSHKRSRKAPPKPCKPGLRSATK
jgi:hypothetical protein